MGIPNGIWDNDIHILCPTQFGSVCPACPQSEREYNPQTDQT